MTDPVNVLYLEKDHSLADWIKQNLEGKRCFVDISFDEADCLQKLSHSTFDLLILECYSSSASALEVLKHLSRQQIDVPAILVLGDYQFKKKVKAMPLACTNFVVTDGADYFDLLELSIESVFEKIHLFKTIKQLEKELDSNREIADRVQSIAKVGNWEYYPGENVAKWSRQEFRNFGYQPGAVVPTYDKYIDVVHPDDRDLVEQHNYNCVEKHKSTEFVFRLLINNQIRYIRAITEVDLDQNGAVIRIFGVSQDITEQQKVETRIKQAATVFENTTEAIFITDENSNIISTNAAFSDISGYSEQQVLGQKPTLFASGHHDAQFFYALWTDLKQHGSWQGEVWNRHQDGHVFPTWQSITAIKDAEGNIIQYVSIFSDITKRKESEELIRYQANYDSLTDLPNRTLFCDRMDLAIKQAKRSGMQVGLMLIDLDHFKWVNDTLGHRAGDYVLEETAKRLKQAVRNSDTVARLGGDEFTVILPELQNSKDAELIAEKIFATFVAPVDIEGSEVFISGSIGISLYPDDGGDVETLQKNADSAMYSAKEAGRNRFHYFTTLMQAEADRRMILINHLRRAIDRSQFSIYYQPIIDVTDGHIVSAEALIRWNQPVLGFISPAEFIPLAEESGLMIPIGNWVVNKVADDMQRWQKSGLKQIQISINKSPKQFLKGDYIEDWKSVFTGYGVSPSNITVEITESVFMERESYFIETLSKMQSEGMQISLDDFGTGYSSLSYLKRFPVDILKIDKEFIDDVCTNRSDALLVETIITLAEKMQIKVIAEGVETKEQLDFLKKNNCRYVQGYYYSKPLPCSEFEVYLETH